MDKVVNACVYLVLLFTLITSVQASQLRPENYYDSSVDAWAIATQNIFFNTIELEDPTDPVLAKEYLLAGGHQFHTLWARDFSMSVGGALIVNQYKAVKDSLEILLGNQREDGLIPRTVDNRNINTRVILGLAGTTLRFKQPLKPWFKTENGVIAIDSNVVVPWAASVYVLRERDRKFARKWFEAIEKALKFFESGYLVDGLIGNQPPFSDWEDSVKRGGRVAFTNVFYILALRGASDWASFIGEQEKSEFYSKKSLEVTKKFHDYFWIPERKILRNFEGDDRLTADANLMAVTYGILSKEDSVAVMKVLRESPLWSPMPGRPTWPDYPKKMKSFNVKLAGIQSYHDSMYWLWITALAARAERAIGNCKGYDEIMGKLSHRISKDGDVYEVFDLKKGKLVSVRRTLYTAEKPFTWSSAMYLEAATKGCKQ